MNIWELTPREHDVMRLIATGDSNRQIGEELDLAEKTIKNYMTSILGKLEARNRTEAAMIFLRGTSS